MPRRRLLLDVTTVCRWLGPAAGIARVERAFAVWAHHHRPDCELVFFDPRIMRYRALAHEHRLGLITGDIAVDLRNVQRQIATRRRFIETVPTGMVPALNWVMQFRRQLLLTLEARRLTAGDEKAAVQIDRLQRRLMTPKYRDLMVKDDGTRRPFLGVDDALQTPIMLGSGDVVISVGAGWNNVDVDEIARQKARDGFRLAILCQDIIPILFPQFYRPHDVANFRSYFDVAFPLADLLLFSSRSAEHDARAYCRDQGMEIRRTAITPFGANAAVAPSGRRSVADLGLESQKFAMFVSTIEPRKGHGFLLDVWRRLLADGIPQRQGFKLVLVGRPGWMVDDVLADLRAESAASGSLVLVHDADDDMLATLYRSAAFCLYPSAYEGYGLPIIEALQHGKAVIASNGGPMAEVVDGFSPCLDPRDEDGWTRLLAEWIESPSARAPYEADIRRRFVATGWDEAARRFFELIDEGVPGS